MATYSSATDDMNLPAATSLRRRSSRKVPSTIGSRTGSDLDPGPAVSSDANAGAGHGPVHSSLAQRGAKRRIRAGKGGKEGEGNGLGIASSELLLLFVLTLAIYFFFPSSSSSSSPAPDEGAGPALAAGSMDVSGVKIVAGTVGGQMPSGEVVDPSIMAEDPHSIPTRPIPPQPKQSHVNIFLAGGPAPPPPGTSQIPDRLPQDPSSQEDIPESPLLPFIRSAFLLLLRTVLTLLVYTISTIWFLLTRPAHPLRGMVFSVFGAIGSAWSRVIGPGLGLLWDIMARWILPTACLSLVCGMGVVGITSYFARI